ncbi:MAG: acyl-CoA dehydrogenase family protein [Promethearchaeota archaeon]|jgi:alkylation response protein AidB-like acyl-CoA dehydrogenase
MDFTLTENQNMLRKITREFAEEYLVPVAQESDEKQELDDTAFQKMKEMNYFGVCVPEEFGGAGLHNDTILRPILSTNLELMNKNRNFLRILQKVKKSEHFV